jgi:hypothetical protein
MGDPDGIQKRAPEQWNEQATSPSGQLASISLLASIAALPDDLHLPRGHADIDRHARHVL